MITKLTGVLLALVLGLAVYVRPTGADTSIPIDELTLVDEEMQAEGERTPNPVYYSAYRTYYSYYSSYRPYYSYYRPYYSYYRPYYSSYRTYYRYWWGGHRNAE